MTDWIRLVNDHGPCVFRLARRITGRDEDAEDVLQDVFLEAFEYQKHAAIRDWTGLLRRKTTHRSLDRLRRRRPAVSLQDVDPESRSHGPFEAAVFNELTAALRDAIARLPHQQAEGFCLKYFDGLSNAEIATCLETSPGAVATSLHKARQALAAVFNEDLEEQSL